MSRTSPVAASTGERGWQREGDAVLKEEREAGGA